MHIGKYIDMILYDRYLSRSTLANMVNMNPFDLEEKLKSNRLSAVELLKIARVLDLDLNRMKKKVY